MPTPENNSEQKPVDSEAYGYRDSLDMPENAQLVSELDEEPVVRTNQLVGFNRLALKLTAAALIFIILVGGISLLASRNSAKPLTQQSVIPKAGSYAVGSLKVQNISTPNQQLQLGQISHLDVNGELRVSNAIVLVPGSTPSSPTAGQIYYDSAKNAPYYYNGSQFINLAPTPIPQYVSAIGGVSGNISVGSGLQVTNGQLDLSTTVAQQLSNPKFSSLSAGSANLAVSQDGNGNYTLTDSSIVGSGNVGNIALFTGSTTLGSSILNQSGTTLTVSGALTVTNTISSNTLQQTAAGSNVNVSAGNDSILFTAGGRTFQFPTSGPNAQVICTTGISCAAGGGQAVLLQPGAAQLDTGAGSAVFINNTGGGNLLELQGAGSDRFVVSNNGNTIINGTLAVSGANLALGIASATNGAINFKNSTNSNTLTLQSGISGSSFSLTLPVTKGNNGDCLQSNGAGVLSFNSCTGGPGGGVSSIDSQTGIVNLNNSAGAGGNITINDASTAQKGIAQFNNTNFSAAGGVINTIQGIATTSAPTFAGLTLTSQLTVANGGTGANSLTSNGILYGNGAGVIQATSAAANSILATDGSNIPGLTQTLPTAVQTNITSTGSLGAGSITNGFGAITTGNNITTTAAIQGGTLNIAGGNFTIDASGNFVAAGTAAIRGGGGLTIGVAGTTGGNLNLANSSSSRLVVLQGLSPSGAGNATIQLPSVAGGTTDTICLSSLQNCAAVGGAGGDLTGSYPNPTIAKLQGTTLTISALGSGQILQYNGAAFVNQTVSGDVTINGSGVTAIGAGKVSNADLVNSSITLNNGTNVTGGGSVSLGGNLTLSVVNNPSFSGLLTANGGLTVATGSTFTNASSTLLSSVAIANHAAGGNIGTAAATVDVATTFDVTQTTAGQTLTLASPTTTTSGRIVYINSLSGNASFTMYGVSIAASTSAAFIWNGTAWIPTSTGGTGVNTIGTIDSQSKSANGAVISGSSIYLQSADASFPGLVTTGAQTLAGAKTFSGAVTVQGAGSFTAAGTGLSVTNNATIGGTLGVTSDFSINTNKFNVTASSGNTSIAGTLAVTGASTLTGQLNANGGIVTNNANINAGTGTITSGNINGQTISSSANFTGTVTLATLGSATNTSYICYNSSNQLASCNTGGSGTAFVQGGNSFGAQAVLGTNDSNSLALETNGTKRAILDTSGNITFQQASTINVASAATGTILTVQGGAATGGTNVGGSLLLQGGAGASTGATGSVIVRANTNDSTSTFLVQNATSANILQLNTTSQVDVQGGTDTGALGINGASVSAGYALNVTGSVNATAIYDGGTRVCTSSGCAPVSGSSFYIQNSTSPQSNTNFNIQALAATVAAVIQGASGQDILQVKDSTANVDFKIGSTGSALFQTSTNSATAFQLQNAAGTPLINVNTINGNTRIGLGVYNTGTIAQATTAITGTGTTFTSAMNGGTIIYNDGTIATITFVDATHLTSSVSKTVVAGSSYTIHYGGLLTTSTGSVIARNTTDSTTAFQIQNATGSNNLFIADTSNSLIGIGAAPSAANAAILQVTGLLSVSSLSSSAGSNVVCWNGSGQLANCTSLAGSGNYILNGNSLQTAANFDIQAVAGTIAAVIQGASGQDVLQAKDSTGNIDFKVGSTGNTLFQTSTNSPLAFQIQNAASSNVLAADTTTVNNIITNSDFESGTTGWAGTNATISQSSSQDFTGSNALQIVTTSAGGYAFYTYNAMAQNTQYALSFYAKSNGININTINIGYTYNGTPTDVAGCTAQSITPKAWARLTCTFTTPNTVSTNNANIYIKDTANAHTFFVDTVQLQTGANATAWGAVGALQVSGLINSSVTFQPKVDALNALQVLNSTGTSNVLVVDTINGRIGINTVPSTALDVSGAVNVAGTVTASSVNATSNFTTSGSSSGTGYYTKAYLAGTGSVNSNDVVIAANDSGSLRAIDTTTIRDIRVLGVMSDSAIKNPGSITNIAISGNYQVNADTGAVSLGDQLVTSTTSGAVTVDNNATTGILGIAMSTKSAGSTGLVNVMIRPVGGVTNPNIPGTLTAQGSVQGSNGSGSNSSGSNLVLNGGQGTGNANGGNITLQVAAPGSSGSSLNSLTTVLTVNGSNGSTQFQNSVNSTTGFQIQNSSSASLFNVDTSTTSNLITMGGFEGGTTGWSAKGSTTISQSNAQAWQGNNSLSVATTTAANDGTKYNFTFGVTTQYTFSLYAKVSSGSISDIVIGRQDQSGTDINCLTSQTLTTSWVRFSCTFTTGGTISSSSVYIQKSSGSAETFFIDGVQLQTGATATAYNPGGALQLNGIINSPLAIQNKSDSPNEFQIQNAAGTSLFNADSSNLIITIAGTSSTFASLTLTNAHFKSTQTTAPTIGTPANCGTSPSSSVQASATDSAGSFRITSGTGSPTTCDSVITFNKAYGGTPKSIIVVAETQDGGTGSAAARQVYVSASSSSTFTIKFNSSPAASEVNWYYYWVVE